MDRIVQFDRKDRYPTFEMVPLSKLEQKILQRKSGPTANKRIALRKKRTR